MKSLITTDRHRVSSASHNSLIATSQSDRSRVIYSASFRRLQQKAQVFSLESNSSVRSRLTHSIEVSHIGRYIVSQIIQLIDDSQPDFDDEVKKFWREHSLTISNIVETACLMHDIGNPPFGHFGEAAIVDWANSNELEEALKSSLRETSFDTNELSDELLQDFKNFDGNPQGFRIVAKTQGDDGYHGLNLTYTQLTALLKYPYDAESRDVNRDKPFTKKVGFFRTEKKVIHDAWKALNMPDNSRHPLSFLMEASDDISYCLSDIEDGIEKNVITFEQFKESLEPLLLELIGDDKDKKKCETLIEKLNGNKHSPISPFLAFKTELQNLLVAYVAETFIESYESFCNLKINTDIISGDTVEKKILDGLKSFSRQYLFSSSEAESIELSGYAIISGILEEYQRLLKLSKDEFLIVINNDFKAVAAKKLHVHRRLFKKLPEKHLHSYKAAILDRGILPAEKSSEVDEEVSIKFSTICPKQEWILRAHLIVDFVSGMTDQFSMEFFQSIKGIKVG
ncbi:dGTPase [Aliidiomarina shirensis]|uniref:dGTPase n=1 Tax=Aliidiomarina shirensis TaxID=1048642 RepID=A0A432WQC1_9GAMM|nr:dGTPase [Aliidiomarina shirensis]RUO35948.1 dGTPase [Aliidiomarina shirensis]